MVAMWTNYDGPLLSCDMMRPDSILSQLYNYMSIYDWARSPKFSRRQTVTSRRQTVTSRRQTVYSPEQNSARSQSQSETQARLYRDASRDMNPSDII